VSKLVDWLRVFRANTMPVALLTVLAGFLAGGGDLFSPLGLGFAGFAWLAHHFTFGLNSLLDAPYDAIDKPAEHPPLVGGAISHRAANIVIHAGLFATAFLGIALALSGRGSASISLTFLLLSVVLGYAYNAGLSKVTVWSSLLLSLSFTFLFLFAYFAVTVSVIPLMPPLAAYIFLTFWFEHSWGGNLKDLGESGANLLHNLGVRVSGMILEIPERARVYAWGIKLAGVGLVTSAILREDPPPPVYVLWFAFVSVALFSCHELTRGGRWNRNRLLCWIGCEELASLSLALVVVAQLAGWAEVLTLIMFSFAWVVTLSRVLYPKSFGG